MYVYVCLFVLLGSERCHSSSTLPNQSVIEYMLRSEGEWAAACSTGHTERTERCCIAEVSAGNVSMQQRVLADDFSGLFEGGHRYSKADCLQNTNVTCRSNHFNGARIVFQGDALEVAVAYGNETWITLEGSKGMYVWTDVWVRRNASWFILSATDVVVNLTSPSGELSVLPRIPNDI